MFVIYLYFTKTCYLKVVRISQNCYWNYFKYLV